MAYKIQHLKISGILDQSIAVVKDNFTLLFTILLFAFIPIQVIGAVLNLAVMPDVGIIPKPEDLAQIAEAQSRYGLLFTVIGIVQFLVVLPLTNAAVIHAVAEKYLGRTVTAAQAIQRGLKKLVPLIWTAFIMYLAIFGGMILLIIPGILFALWFGLSQHTVVLEDLSGVKALSRSKALVRPNLGTLLILGILVLVITWMLLIGAAMIPQRHVKTIASIVISSGATLFSTAAFVVYYFSCRCVVDNFDLEHLAASVDAASADERAPDKIAGAEF